MRIINLEMRPFGNRKAFTLLELIIVLIVIIGVAWGVKALFFKSKPSTVNVGVWITLKSGESIKLGNVPILLMSQENFATLLPNFNELLANSAERDKRAIDTSINGMREGRKMAMGTLVAEYSALREMAREDVQKYNDLRFLIHDTVTSTYLNADSNSNLKALMAYTDSEGKATLTAPNKKDKWYVIATTERQVGNRVEKYCWLVPLIFTKGTAEVILSNNNLWDLQADGAAVGLVPPPALPSYPELR